MSDFTKSSDKKAYTTDPHSGIQYLSAHVIRLWNTQRKPYRSPLPFELYRWTVENYITNSNSGFNFYPDEWTGYIAGTAEINQATNKAYGKLTDQLGNQSQWANNLLEAKDSIGMIESRALQLARTAINLRKGNFGAALSGLAMPNTSKNRKKLEKAKSFGNQWLELHFGWQPAIEDISNGLNTLSKTDFGMKKVVASATVRYRESFDDRGDNTHHYYLQSNTFKCRLQTNVRISNPNAYLANQFGVANPLSVAWEAVPYSFVVDWFSNVGQCLNSMTDFLGLDTEWAFTTRSQEGVRDDTSVNLYPNATYPDLNMIMHNYKAKAFIVTRAPGLPLPVLALKPFKGFSITRAATGIALLLQKL